MINCNLNGLKDAPILVEIFRGTTTDGHPIIECVHRGLISIVSGQGEIIYSQGEQATLTHIRSCAKPFQVLPLLQSGFFSYDEKHAEHRRCDLALMMSSHAGAPMHTDRVSQLLKENGLLPSLLRCGVHPPQDETTRHQLLKHGQMPSVLHNNCSGKHVAMLIACQKFGFDMSNYDDPHHPLQQEIRRIILALADLSDQELAHGIDGCSLPAWALPLEKLALMYARLAYWQEHLPANRPPWLKAAFKQIWQAFVTCPEYVAGDRRFDTELIRAGHGQIVSKTGADGVHALAILPCKDFPSGLGIAIKIADGDPRQTIRPLVLKDVLGKLDLWPNEPALDKFLPSFSNFRGFQTGGARISTAAIK